MEDVLKEAKAIRDALSLLGWEYRYGGPYPMEPTMHFSRNGTALEVSIREPPK